MENIGIYIHIPFCKQKCSYCDFVSFADKEIYEQQYIEAIKKEIEYKAKIKYQISTIYIGGGTPSFINEKHIADILKVIRDKFDVNKDAEITIEVNPGTVDKQKLEIYKKAGINRLSIGLQSTNNRILKQIGRIHTYEQFLETYKLAKEAGFTNINVDLMLALPNQTLEDIQESVENVIKLKPTHISVYSLILEDGTALKKKVDDNVLTLPDDELERKMYWSVKDILERSGYIHYEISNFAKAGYESRHNKDCWEQREYIGIGLAAHSYLNRTRFSNTCNLQDYINNIKNGEFEKNITIHERQTIEDAEKEYMLLGLRKIEGVDIQDFKNRYIDNPIYVFHKELEKLVNEELVEIDLNKIRLTKKGLDLANLVWEEFV